MAAAPSPASSAPAGGPFAPLLERGITQRVLAQAGLTLVRRYDYPYWRYPVYGVDGTTLAWRYKRAGDDRSRRKYDWGTEDLPARADTVYNLWAIAEGRPAVVCAGEPDVWLLASLRVRACSLLAGEGSVPEAAVDALCDRRPKHVLVLYDNDETGQRGAARLVLALRARAVHAVARTLPPEVGPHGDVTDLFRLCGRDRDCFMARVRALPDVEPAHEPARPSPVALPAYRPAGSSPIERFKGAHPLAEVIEAAGVALVPHQGGAYLQGRCPFHDDRDPSFVVWPERGYWKCYGCGARGDVLDFGRLMLRQGSPALPGTAVSA